MLISKTHRFLFIHIVKTAGSSITEALRPFTQPSWRKPLNGVLKKFGIHRFDEQPYPPHIRAAELRTALGRAEFDRYFSFAIVRNPWDWLVSLYTFIRATPSHRHYDFVQQFHTFEPFLEWRCTEEIILQNDFVFSETGEQLVNFIGRYENLEADFRRVCARLGIKATLPKLNVSRRRPYHEFYRPATVDLVRKIYAPDIESFQYDFRNEDHGHQR